MTEILTESFCERCGTRYTFESARPKARLKGVRVLSRGLKNFVLSDDNSMDEAMAAARSETDRELTAHQLDAFHKTFNFCMSCRQYTCPNCWNESEARCLTCAPHLGHEVMPAPFPDLVTSSYLIADPVDTVPANGSHGSNGSVHDVGVDETPSQGVDTSDFAARLQALMAPPTTDAPAETRAEPVEVVAEGTAIDAIVPDITEDVAIDSAPDDEPFAEIELASTALVVPEAAADVEETAEIEPVAQIEVASEAPIAAEVPAIEALAEPVAAELEPIAAEVEPIAAEVEPIAAEVETVAAEVEPIAEEPDDAAQIAARLAAWSAAAVVMDAAREDEPATTPDITEKGASQTGGFLRRFRAGQNLDAELDEYERQQAATPPVADQLAPEVVAEADVVAEPEAVATAEPEVVSEPAAAPAVQPEVAAAAALAAMVTPEPDVAPEPGAAAEPEVVAEPAAAPAVQPEVAAAAALAAMVTPEPDVAPEPEIAAAAVEPDVAAAAVQPEIVADAEPEVAAQPAPPIDVIEQPTWQTFAPDPTELPSGPPPASTPSIPAAASAADPNAEPQWPTHPEWPGVASPSAGLPFLNRPPTPTGGVEALWAASAREVVAPANVPGRPAAGAVQPCVSCGLSLSATARFCRRCGTPQAT